MGGGKEHRLLGFLSPSITREVRNPSNIFSYPFPMNGPFQISCGQLWMGSCGSVDSDKPDGSAFPTGMGGENSSSSPIPVRNAPPSGMSELQEAPSTIALQGADTKIWFDLDSPSPPILASILPALLLPHFVSVLLILRQDVYS